MTHTPLGFYLLLGAAFSWVGLLTCVGLCCRARSQAMAEADRGHMAAVASLLAELVDQAGELGVPGEIVQDAREFQVLVADVLDGGAALSVQEARDLSNFLHDLTLALPYLPAEGAGEGSTGLSAADRFAEQVGLTVMASSPLPTWTPRSMTAGMRWRWPATSRASRPARPCLTSISTGRRTWACDF